MVEYTDSKHCCVGAAAVPWVAQMPLKRPRALPRARGGLSAAPLWLREADTRSGGRGGQSKLEVKEGVSAPSVAVQGCLPQQGAVGLAEGPLSISCPGQGF